MSRIQSIDVLRVLAIVCVIAIHTSPFATPSSPIGTQLDFATWMHLPTRFAVPFFFILSGYFWAHKFKDREGIYAPTVTMLRRVAFLFLVWSAIYLLPTNILDTFAYGPFGPVKQLYWNVENALTRPVTTVLQGTKGHLWFLMALLWSVAIAAVLLRYKQTWVLVVLSLVLYLIGLAGKAYADSPLGFLVDFNFRNGPFFSLIFFVTGYFLYQRKPHPAWLRIGCLIAVFGFLIQLLELSVLQEHWGTTMSQDYVIGTYFFGLGVAMMGLSNSPYLSFSGAAAIGPLVLGIYASHYIFVDVLKPFEWHLAGNWIWSIAYVGAVFLLSYALARFMLRFAFTRKLVI